MYGFYVHLLALLSARRRETKETLRLSPWAVSPRAEGRDQTSLRKHPACERLEDDLLSTRERFNTCVYIYCEVIIYIAHTHALSFF